MSLNHGTAESFASEDTFDHSAQQKAVTDNNGDSQQQQEQEQQSCILPKQEQEDANVAPADQLVNALLEASKRVTRSTTRRVSQEAAAASELENIEKLAPSQEGDVSRENADDDAEYVPEHHAVSRNTRSRSSSVSSTSTNSSGRSGSGRGRSSTRSTAKRTSTSSVDLSYIETNKRGSIRVTRNVNAISERKMTEPVVYPESDVLYIYDVSDWDDKMSFYDKIAYSFGVPSTQKVVFCHYFNCKVMHYERTCQGVYHCPKREEFEELQKKGESSSEGGSTEEDFLHCTVKPSRFRFHTCQQHQTPLKRSKKCKFKLHFYVPQDKDDNRRLLLCIGTHSHALLPEDPRNPVTRGIVSHSDIETSPKTKSRTRTRSNSVSSTSTTSSKSRTRRRRKSDDKSTAKEVKKRVTSQRKSVDKHELSDNNEDGWNDKNNDDRDDEERQTTKRPKTTDTNLNIHAVPQLAMPQQPLLSQYPLSQHLQPHQYIQPMYDPHQVPLHSQSQMQQALLQHAHPPAHLQQMLLNIQQLQQQQQLLQQTQPQYQLAMIQAQLQQQQQQLRLSMQLASHLQQVQTHNALVQQQHQQPPQTMYQPPLYQQSQKSSQQQSTHPQYGGHPEQDKAQSQIQISQSQQNMQPQIQKEQQQQHQPQQPQSKLGRVEHIENTLERSDAAVTGSDLISQLPQSIGNQSGPAPLSGNGGHSNSNHSLGINPFGYGTNSNHSFSHGFFNPSHSFGPSNGNNVGFHSFTTGGYPFQNVSAAPLNSSWSHDQWPSGNSLYAMFDHGENTGCLPPIGNLDREESLISSAEQSSIRPSMQNGLIADADMGGQERDGLNEMADEASKRKGNPISLSAFFNDPQYPQVFHSGPNNPSNTICFASSDDVAKFVADSKSSGMQKSTRESVNVETSDPNPVSGAGSAAGGNATAFAYPRGSIKPSHAVNSHESMLPPTHTTKNKHVLRLISEDSEHSTSVSLPPISSLTGSQRWWDEALKGDKNGDSNSSSNSFSVSSTNQCDSIGTAPGSNNSSGSAPGRT